METTKKVEMFDRMVRAAFFCTGLSEPHTRLTETTWELNEWTLAEARAGQEMDTLDYGAPVDYVGSEPINDGFTDYAKMVFSFTDGLEPGLYFNVAGLDAMEPYWVAANEGYDVLEADWGLSPLALSIELHLVLERLVGGWVAQRFNTAAQATDIIESYDTYKDMRQEATAFELSQLRMG